MMKLAYYIHLCISIQETKFSMVLFGLVQGGLHIQVPVYLWAKNWKWFGWTKLSKGTVKIIFDDFNSTYLIVLLV